MIPSSPCATEDQCCISLYSIAAHLLAEVFDAVTECAPTAEGCPPLAAYVTLGNGDDGITDSLTVSAGSITPSPNTVPGGLGLHRALFNIRLVESGWPTARQEGQTLIFPPADEQARAAQHVYSMGEAIHRRLSFLMSKRALTPPEVRCSNATVGQMNPIPPLGGTAGWTVPVTVDLPWN